MQYALLHRFQATLFGAVLGEAIGLQRLRPNMPALGRRSGSKTPQTRLQWAALTQFYTQQMLQPTRFDRVEFGEKPLPKTAGETIVALLPIVLFFHEDRQKLEQTLKQTAVWQPSAIAQQESFAVARAIADALQEKLDPHTLMATVMSRLTSLSRDATNSSHPFEQVQRLLDEQAGLETACDRVSTNSDHDAAIALAFYCFLSTPYDLRLALLRAAQTGPCAPLVGALTGALSGAFNSLSGIPIDWQLALDAWEISSEETTTQPELLNLANCLLASWSGVYEPLTFSKEFGQVPAIAAPQVIRRVV